LLIELKSIPVILRTDPLPISTKRHRISLGASRH
jgi:hypothetical protein